MSSAAELNLTSRCVRGQATSAAFQHCTTPALVLLYVVGSLAKSLSVYTFTDWVNVTNPIEHLAIEIPISISQYVTYSSRRHQ